MNEKRNKRNEVKVRVSDPIHTRLKAMAKRFDNDISVQARLYIVQGLERDESTKKDNNGEGGQQEAACE